MNMCQIWSIYLNVNKSYGKNIEFQWNLELVVVGKINIEGVPVYILLCDTFEQQQNF
jgi:hypothetical protein